LAVVTSTALGTVVLVAGFAEKFAAATIQWFWDDDDDDSDEPR
jgi:hypothetical protein